MRPYLPPLAALAALIPAAAQAQDAQRTADMRCVVVAAQVAAGAASPDLKAAMAAGVMYYLGKIKGREPGLDLKPVAAAEFAIMTTEDAKREAARCSTEMAALGKETEDISSALKAKGARP